MDAHANEAVAHTHPGPAVYLRIALVLFVVTAMEVAVYELSHRGGGAEAVIGPIMVPLLLLLSAVKFALVAMFYMHLRQDHRLFSGLFVFPLIVAAVIIFALMIVFSYTMHYNGLTV